VSAANFKIAFLNMKCEPLISSKEAAELLGGLHRKTVERMARRKEIPAMKVGKYWMFRASLLDDWIKKQLDSPCSPCRPGENQQ
jgi:excisionase family DNA binding protein